MKGNEEVTDIEMVDALDDEIILEPLGLSDGDFRDLAKDLDLYADAPEVEVFSDSIFEILPEDLETASYHAEYRIWYGERWCPRQSKFGGRGGKHGGVDLFAHKGTRMGAIVDGSAQWNPRNDPNGWGNHLFLNFRYKGGNYTFIYAHLTSKIGNFPRRVKRNEAICTSGCTGNAGGPGSFCGGEGNRCNGASDHIHLELYGPSGQMDPIAFLGWNIKYAGDNRCYIPSC